MASTLQGYLEKVFGVRLAVNPDGSNASESAGNVILLDSVDNHEGKGLAQNGWLPRRRM